MIKKSKSEFALFIHHSKEYIFKKEFVQTSPLCSSAEEAALWSIGKLILRPFPLQLEVWEIKNDKRISMVSVCS
jgi:hypothetical protein